MSGSAETVTNDVKEYYGKILAGTKDLKTNACTIASSGMPKHVKQALKLVHDDVTSRYYGCGLVIPDALEGMSVLDLGSGSGQDCYVLSKLVGEKGHVTGLDMTEEQLKIARDYIQYHTETFGFKSPNVDFVQGYIEKLGEAGLKDNTFDIIISNCVVNLSPDKRAVIKEAYRVLKEGGELYFSDVYADRVIPEELRAHKVLWGECVSGALCWEELMQLAAEIGFSRPRIVSANPFVLGNEELQKVVGDYKFASVTYRLFKLPQKQSDPCDAMYNGSITACEDEFVLDYGHKFASEQATSVCGEIASILKSSRFRDDFTFRPSKAGSNQQCKPGGQKVDIVNPFEYFEVIGADPGGCCSPAENTKNGGCC